MVRTISGKELAMKVKLTHNVGIDNFYKCKKCNHDICWCCNDGSCDSFSETLKDINGDPELCPCMNDDIGCEVDIEI